MKKFKNIPKNFCSLFILILLFNIACQFIYLFYPHFHQNNTVVKKNICI